MASTSRDEFTKGACHLAGFETKIYSQNGEDGIIRAIFDILGESDRLYVEIGCEDGQECNTRLLREGGWDGWMFDAVNQREEWNLFQERVDCENISAILNNHSVPKNFDLLSLDIDFNDFHVLNQVLRSYRPRVIVVEHNSSFGPTLDAVVPYLPHWNWDGTQWFGASLSAFCALALKFNYTPVYVESNGVNLFLVDSSEWGDLPVETPNDLYRAPKYGPRKNGHPPDSLGRPLLSSRHYLLNGVQRANTRFGVISFLGNDEYIGRAFLNGGYWEEAEVVAIGQKLNLARGTCIDVGSHVGSHAIAIAAQCPNISFICFEPQHILKLVLERNIAENSMWERIKVFGNAVAHKSCQVRLSNNFSDGSSANTPIRYDNGRPANYGGVQLGTGDTILDAVSLDNLKLSGIIYIKVDVEGAERLVFYGARELIQSQMPLILFENRVDRILDDDTLNFLQLEKEIRAFDIKNFLIDMGYELLPLGLDLLASPSNEFKLTMNSCIDPSCELAPTKSLSSMNISAILFQTWKTRDNLPDLFSKCRDSFLTATAGFARPLWSDDDNLEFISCNFSWFLPIYEKYPAEIYRADAVRYFFLYAYGGIYADLDVFCLRSLNSLAKFEGVLLGRMGTDPSMPHSIPNAIMASQARHPFWLVVIGKMIKAAEQGFDARPEHMTGPVILKQAFDIWNESKTLASEIVCDIQEKLPMLLAPADAKEVRVLDSYHWFPLDWTDSIHQRFRVELIKNRCHLSVDECKSLFPKSTMTTFWSHSWE